MPLTTDAADLALRAIFAPGVKLALTRGGEEIQDAGYQSQSFQVSEPVTMDRFRLVTNRDKVWFGPWAQDGAQPIEGWQVVTPAGQVLAEDTFKSDDQTLPQRGGMFVIHEHLIRLGFRG